jgi:hypothetical protein
VLASLLEAAGFALWTALPGLPAFAAGFVLWGLGGALASGAAEALVYDGLAGLGEEAAYPRVNGRIAATQLLAQLPSAALATGLFRLGGWPLVGWASVALCLLTAAVAARFPEAPHAGGEDDDGGRVAARAVLAELRRPAVVLAVLAVAVVGGIDAVEEYFPVLAGGWGVPTALVPVAVVAIPLTGALGAALAGRAGRLPGAVPAGLLAAAGVLLAAAALWARPAALAVVAVAYGLYLAVLVGVEARLQERIPSRSRATLTSVAALGLELASLLVFAAWAVHGALAVAVLVLAAVPVLLLALRSRG